MLKHCSVTKETIFIFDQLYKNQKSAIVVLGHHGNWEWAASSVSLVSHQPLYIIYHPIKNSFVNILMKKIRGRFGADLIPMKETFRQMKINENMPVLTAFVADQSPVPEHAYWLKFLNQDTAFFKGVEKMSIKLKQEVIFMDIIRQKRGYYKVHAQMIDLNSNSKISGYITSNYVKSLENFIRHQPETWLWSHRRWKHKKISKQQCKLVLQSKKKIL